MSDKQSHLSTFGSFRLDTAARSLTHYGNPVTLAPKTFDLLVLLVESGGRLLEERELMVALWPDTLVNEANLSFQISILRKALQADGHNLIETVPKHGYRFTGRAERLEFASAPVWKSPERESRPGVTVPIEVLLADCQSMSRVTLAVLPFECFGAGSELEYLADGLTEEVIAALGQIDPEHMNVIGRTTMMAYKRTAKSLADIGRELGAGFLVESSIRAEDARLRITSNLIRARDQVHIWGESYDGQPASVLAFQRELSNAIALEVRLRLSPERLGALAQRHPSLQEAYDFYLRGRYFWNQLTPLTTRRAIELYTRATELDPEYALAWSGLSDAFAASPINADAPPKQMWERAREAAANAVSAGPELAAAHTSLGLMKFWLDWEWTAAETALGRAIALDPSYALAHRMLGVVYSHMGRHREGLASACRARELDPLDATHCALSAQIAFNARDFSEALELSRRANVLNPEFWVGYYQRALAYEQLGQSEMALAALQKAAMTSSNSKVIGLRGYILAKLGHSDEAREVLHALEAVSRERYVPPYASALVHAGLGEPETALDGLQRALDVHDVHLAFLPVDPKWDPFRGDPRFATLLERCAFEADSAINRSSHRAAEPT
jgi:TolB-like protein/DNA-binding winged helix-turn-helix (wHTH) protein/Tfp pilus assembly protein PilF